MAYKITDMSRPFWTEEREAILRRGYRGYEDTDEICRQINAAEGSRQIERSECYMLAFKMKLKRPLGYATVAAVRRAHAAKGKPVPELLMSSLIRNAKHLAKQTRTQRNRAKALAKQQAAEAKELAARAHEIHAMTPPPKAAVGMGKPPARPFSMLAMSLEDPIVARRIRDMQHASDGRLTPRKA